MGEALISGTIASIGYLHVKYGNQRVDGRLYTLYDIVIEPKDDRGTVSFHLPKGIIARIELWSERNGILAMSVIVRVPKTENVALTDLVPLWNFASHN